MSGQDLERPLIEFPCANYPIKVIGNAFEGSDAAVLEVVAKHASLCAAPAPAKPSRNGRFVSLTLFITATGEAQLGALNDELKALSFVKMVM